jgi:hypothetical protein
MTFDQASNRLKNRVAFLETKVADLEANGGSAYWFRQDLEALQIGIAAISYTREMQQYEQSEFPTP